VNSFRITHLTMLSFDLALLTTLAHAINAEKKNHGLIIVDLQYDFVDPDGTFSLFTGDDDDSEYTEYIDLINDFLESTLSDYDFVVYSINTHPSDHCSFAETLRDLDADVSSFDIIDSDDETLTDKLCRSEAESQVLWPTHCVRGTPGSRLVADVYDIRPVHDSQRVLVWRDADLDEEYTVNYGLANSSLISSNASFLDDLHFVQQDQSRILHSDLSQVFYVFKGGDVDMDSYSVFKQNDGETDTGLSSALHGYGYNADNTDLTVFGIGYDYAVFHTVSDAVELGYDVTVMDQLTVPILQDDTDHVVEDLIAMGVAMDYSTEWNTECGSNCGDEEESETQWILGLTALVLIVVVPVAMVIRRNILRNRQSQPEEIVKDTSDAIVEVKPTSSTMHSS